MGTELIRVRVKEDNDDILSYPPGFETFSTFNLKRVHDGEKAEGHDKLSYSPATSSSASHSVPLEMESEIFDDVKGTRSLRRKPLINYGLLDDLMTNEMNPDFPSLDLSQKPGLPKGVVRGCAKCSNCQKVTARWRPGYACKPELDDAPVFYPTEEEFKDTLSYIASIREKAEPYGICRIVPPSSWKPRCLLKEKGMWDVSKFATRVQKIDKLQKRESMRKVSELSNHMQKKRRRCMSDPINNTACTESFGFEPGPEFTLCTFQKYADEFKSYYFGKYDVYMDDGGGITSDKHNWEPSVDDIEGEYWRIVGKATEEIEVLYGADVETGGFGSGFPKASTSIGSTENDTYTKSGWNLNNFPRLPGSVLSFESSDISGVLVPWLYVGMCFSSFCWHVEDHHLYSLNYMHWGAPKLWYGVSGRDAAVFEKAMKKNLPDLFEEQPDLLHKLVTQFSPSDLKLDGVPVYRCVQNSGEFVLTFPRAYHSGFNCGFNCAEAVNVAPMDWLLHGQMAVELYSVQRRRTSISHDKLLLGAAREAVKARWQFNVLKNNLQNIGLVDVYGKDGILAIALKHRVEIERTRRNFHSGSCKIMRMESNFDSASERECSICLFDLHLSAAGCGCSPEKYVCLSHAKQLCSCSWGTKFFLFRYEIDELNILVEALEGNASAAYRWTTLDAEIASTSSSHKVHVQQSKLSYPSRNFTFGDIKPPMDSDSSLTMVGISSTNAKNCESADHLRKQHIVSKCRASSLDHSLKESGNNLHASSQKGVTNLLSSLDETAKKPVLKNSLMGFDCSENPYSTRDVSIISDPSRKYLEPKSFMHSKYVPQNSKDNVCGISHMDSSVPVDVKVEYVESSILPFNGASAAVNPFHGGSKVSLESRMKTNSLDAIVSGARFDRLQNSILSGSVQVKVGCYPPEITNHLSDSSVQGCTSTSLHDNNETRLSDVRVTSMENSLTNVETSFEFMGGQKFGSDKMETGISDILENSRSLTGSQSYLQNNLCKYFKQKGPRIAKVVRRINCNVELMESGFVVAGKLWSNGRAIFPRGFKSRVKYFNVLDPSTSCSYISEILDCGPKGPLFMVSLESCPSEMFAHLSPTKCWEMVRERVNQEINKQHKLGRVDLPPLQPPGSLDGFEMFGFLSPNIVQAIEASDMDRLSTAYWELRPYSRPAGNFQGSSLDQLNNDSRTEILRIRSLLRKASREELLALKRAFDSHVMDDRNIVPRIMNAEINDRSK